MLIEVCMQMEHNFVFHLILAEADLGFPYVLRYYQLLACELFSMGSMGLWHRGQLYGTD